MLMLCSHISNYLQPVQPALLRVGQARYYLSFLFLGIRHNLLFVPSHPLNSGMREDDENRWGDEAITAAIPLIRLCHVTWSLRPIFSADRTALCHAVHHSDFIMTLSWGSFERFYFKFRCVEHIFVINFTVNNPDSSVRIFFLWEFDSRCDTD